MSKQNNQVLPIPKKKLVIATLIVSLFILMTVTVYTPNLIFFSQREFFDDNFIDLIRLPFFYGLAAVLLFVLCVALLPRIVVQFITALLIVLSLLIWFQADYFAISYGALDGAALDFSHYDSRGELEIGIMILASILALIFSKFMIKNGVFVVLMVFAGQFALVMFNVVQEPKVNEKQAVVDNEFHHYSTEKNVVLIVLDTFGAEYFQQIIRTKPDLVDAYPGFVSYTDAISNYPATRGSMTSLLTAKMLPDDVKFLPYKKKELPKRGLPTLFEKNNYEVSVVSNSGWLIDSYRKRFMSNIRIDEDLMTEYYSSQLFDYALFRASLHFVKPYVYNEGRWLFSEKVSSQTQIPNTPTEKGRMLLDSLEMAVAVKDEKPRFKMIHLTMPHPEYVYDKYCNKNTELEYWPVERRMLEQSECALTRLNLLLEKYKKLGIYDNALIVVTSDHGARIFNDHENTGFPSQFEMRSSGILLMIKGIGQSAPFRQVDQPVSLIKLAPALIDEHLHNTDYSNLIDHNRLFYAYQNWHASAPGALPDAPLYKVAANYKNKDSWTLLGFGINNCEAQAIPLTMTFESAEREGYCATFGFARPGPKGDGTWTASDDNRIIFNLEAASLNTERTQIFEMDFDLRTFKGQEDLKLNVFINDHLIGSRTVKGNSQQTLELEFPNSILVNEKNVLKLTMPDVKAMKNVLFNASRKNLGIFIRSIKIR